MMCLLGNCIFSTNITQCFYVIFLLLEQYLSAIRTKRLWTASFVLCLCVQAPLILKGLVCGGVSQSYFVETVCTTNISFFFDVFAFGGGDWLKDLSAGDSNPKVATVGDTVVALRGESFAVASV